MAHHADQAGRAARGPDFAALQEFCDLILCGHNEAVFHRCKGYLEKAGDDYGGIPAVLYLLSGQDADPDDPFGNTADEEKQLVKPQYYFISSDAGAPCLEDFFWFIEDGIKTSRGLAFDIDRERFSDDDCIVEWLAALAAQLEDLYIVHFDGAGEDYHFTILNQADCEKAMGLFARMTAHVQGYSYTAFVITDDFQG